MLVLLLVILTLELHISGLSTDGDYLREFSWGLFTSITRSVHPISIGVTGKTVMLDCQHSQQFREEVRV